MSIKPRWTYEDQCGQLAEARAELARYRAANRYLDLLRWGKEVANASWFQVSLRRSSPGILLGQVRLARFHQSDALPLLISERFVSGGVVVVLLASDLGEHEATEFFNIHLRLMVASVVVESATR